MIDRPQILERLYCEIKWTVKISLKLVSDGSDQDESIEPTRIEFLHDRQNYIFSFEDITLVKGSIDGAIRSWLQTNDDYHKILSQIIINSATESDKEFLRLSQKSTE